MKVFKVFSIVSVVYLSCTHSIPPAAPTTGAVHPGMRKISASGKSFLMGTNDSLAKSDEKPAMPVSFTYDYWLDTTEVTQGEYASVIGTSPVADTSAYGKGAAFPVYYVSWFDAVLFCNAKSKWLGLDTVYSYYTVQKSTAGSVYDIVGLRIHYERDGIRLPTEAEWEYAAILNEQPHDSASIFGRAWYAGNALGHTHAVMQKNDGTIGLYDMEGNVFEWTDDWKGAFQSKSVSNLAGALNQDRENERVIKGGAFISDLASLFSICRSATYPTAASSCVEYVGFRCACGIIPSPTYLSPDTSSMVSNPVDMVVADIQPFFRTPNVKLVFVNNSRGFRTLCFIDYNTSLPRINECTDKVNVYMPTISPDGHYVAYCTRDEGFSQSSNIFIRSLDSVNSPLVKLATDTGYVPRWYVDRNSNDTFLIYVNSSVDCNTPEWQSTKTFLQKMSGGKPLGIPQMLTSDGGFHDGISYNGQYLATGFTRLKMRYLSTGTTRNLFVFPNNGKPENGSDQVCNVSICPDSAHPDRCMFLDFGTAIPSTLTGEQYSAHQYLFISEFSGTTLAWYKAPTSEYSWENPEWSNEPRYAVSCAANIGGDAHAIYAIDLGQQNRALKIVEGNTLAHPYLWVSSDANSVDSSLNLDSLGRYDDPPVRDEVIMLAAKMHNFWKYADSLDVIFVGSSMAKYGFNPSLVTDYRCFNFAYNSGDLAGTTVLVDHYIVNQCRRLKAVCMSLDLGWLYFKDGSYVWNNASALTKGFQYDASHLYWSIGLLPRFKEIILNQPWPSNRLEASPNGYFPVDMVVVPAGWGDSTPPIDGFGRTDWTTALPEYQSNLATIRSIAALLANKKLHCVMVNFPVSPHYKDMQYYGYYGPSWSTAEAILGDMRQIERENSYFHFYDANNDGNHDYTNAEALNQNHLDSLGANKLTLRVDSLLHFFLQ
jgi:uncharacterized protein (TIGR02171 family)